jgi:fluoride exporter
LAGLCGIASMWPHIDFLGSAFPFGTLTVNVVGSLIMGLLAGYFALKADPGQAWRLFLATGILGGFTTYSAFSLDTVLLIERGQMAMTLTYVACSLGGSVAALSLGLLLIRKLA